MSMCWLVGLSAELHKNYRMDLQKTWMEDGSQARIDHINLFIFTFSIISQEILHGT